MFNIKGYIKEIIVFFIICFLIFSNLTYGTLSNTTNNIYSGRLVASSDYGIYGDLIYRSVESPNTSVTTIESDFGGVAPFHPYFAQSLNLNDSTFYLSNTIAGFEIFNDTNHNGYIDSGNEIEYFVLLNATQGFNYGTITEQSTNNGTSTYQWISHYYNIDGFPMHESYSSQQKKIIIPSFNITYTLIDTVNSSTLSVKYDIGSWDAYIFYLDNSFNEIRTGTIDLSGLGLSILYTSVIRSNDDVQKVDVSNDGKISNINFYYQSYPIFESSLNNSYTLDNNPTQFPVTTVIVQPNTLLSQESNAWSLSNDYLNNLISFNSSVTNLPAIPNKNIAIQQIFNYRIEYPIWNGQTIHEDPIYKVIKVGQQITIPSSTSPLPPTSSSVSRSVMPYQIPSLDSLNLALVYFGAGIIVISVILVIEKRK